MNNSEREPNFEQISQPKPVKKMAPREIRDELHQGDDEADEAKPMSFPAEGKIPGAKKLDKVSLDKVEQFRLQDELEKTQKEMRSEINIANKISRQLKDGKDELRAQQVREKYEPRIAELADKLQEIFGEKKGVEDLLPQLKQQAEESDAGRAVKIKEGREDKTGRLQKKAAQKDIENAYAKLVDAEDVLAKAEEQRPNAFSRFFSRSKVGKVSVAENAYQRALRAVEEAKKLVAETEKTILDSGIMKPKEKKEGEEIIRGGIRFKKPAKTAPEKPAVHAGEYTIKFKTEPAPATRTVEVNLPKKAPEPEISPEAVLDARQQLEKYVKDISFTYPEHKLVVLQNAAFQENLADNNFQGDSLTLKKTIKHTLEQLAKELKLKPHEEIASLAELMPQKYERFKKMTTADKNFRHYLALKDLEQNMARH